MTEKSFKCNQCKVTYHMEEKPGGTENVAKFRCEVPICKQTYYEHWINNKCIRLYDAT